MIDARIAAVGAKQFNRVSRAQLFDIGLSKRGIDSRVANGRLVVVEPGVYGLAPLLEHDEWGRWMGATLTHRANLLSHTSAASARGFWDIPRSYEIVTRPGSGGPVRHGGVLVFRSLTVVDAVDDLRGIPITTVERTLHDLACHVSPRALARAVRDAVRLGSTSIGSLADYVGAHRGQRGVGRLAGTIARYKGLPLERARSGAEVRAMEVLHQAGRELPLLNQRIAGEEADLSWPVHRLIVEIDGAPFHLDVGEDARKEAIWDAAGWTVRRLPADDVYEYPARLLSLAVW